MSGGKGPQTKITQLAGKAVQFNHCVKKAEGHLKRLGDENDRERLTVYCLSLNVSHFRIRVVILFVLPAGP